MHPRRLLHALVLLGLSATLSAATFTPTPANPTLKGDAVAQAFETRCGIWFVGAAFPPWLTVTLPEKATPDEALALLQAALVHNPVLRVLGLDAAATKQAAAATAYRLSEVPGGQRKIYALNYAGAQPMSSRMFGNLLWAEYVAATQPAAPTMMFQYRQAPPEKILADMVQHFGCKFVVNASLQQPLTIDKPDPVNERDALRWLTDELAKQGLATFRMFMDDHLLTYIVPPADAHLSAKYAYGTDFTKIPFTEETLTQVIPLRYLDAAKVKKFTGPDGSTSWFPVLDPRHHCILEQDTSLQLRITVERWSHDDAMASPLRLDRVPLKHIAPGKMLRLMQDQYPHDISYPDEQGWHQPERLYITVDAADASILTVEGPEAFTPEVLSEIRRLDAEAGVSEGLVKLFETRFGIWFVGMPMPGWAPVNIPPQATAPQAIALLREALRRNPNLPANVHVIGAEGPAARQFAEEALGCRVEELAGSGGKAFAITPAVHIPKPLVATTNPASVPATQPGAGVANATQPDSSFTFSSVDRVEDLLTQFADRFGIVSVVTRPMGFAWMRPPREVHADNAVQILGEIDTNGRFKTMEMESGGRKVLLLPDSIPRDRFIPIAYGADPKKIPLTDDIVTQIIPVKYVPVEVLRTDLSLMSSFDGTADQQHKCLIITETSVKISRLVDIIAIVEAYFSTPRIEYVQLKHASAADVTAAMLAKYGSNAGSILEAVDYGRDSVRSTRYCFDVESQTNSIIVYVPELKMDEVLAAIHKLDVPPAPTSK